MVKYPHAKKIKKIHYVDPEENASETDEQRGRWADEQDRYYRTPTAKIEVRSCFSFIWLDCEPYGNNQNKKKEYNQRSSVFKEFKNNDP